MLPEELFLHLNLDKPFRSRQLFRWLAAGANSFDTMTNLPPALRDKWQTEEILYSTSVEQNSWTPTGPSSSRYNWQTAPPWKQYCSWTRPGEKQPAYPVRSAAPCNAHFVRQDTSDIREICLLRNC